MMSISVQKISNQQLLSCGVRDKQRARGKVKIGNLGRSEILHVKGYSPWEIGSKC